jgi:hypothetical protein
VSVAPAASICASGVNNTGSWYGKEFMVAAASAARILRQLALDELNTKREPT